MENSERNKLSPKTNQLCPTKNDACKWSRLLLFNPLTDKENEMQYQ